MWQLVRYLAFDQTTGVLHSFFIDGGPCVLLAAWAFAYRTLALRTARRLILADRARYDLAWKAVSEGLDCHRTLLDLRDAALAATTTRIQDAGFNYPRIGGGTMGDVQQIRQLVKKPVATLFTGGEGETALRTPRQLLRIRRLESWSEGIDVQPVPLNNLDLLYVQAVLMHPILAHKALDWAVSSSGWFPRVTQGQPGEGLDPLVCPAQEQQCKIQWAQVKKVTRAYEKMQRSYHSVCCMAGTLMHTARRTRHAARRTPHA